MTNRPNVIRARDVWLGDILPLAMADGDLMELLTKLHHTHVCVTRVTVKRGFMKLSLGIPVRGGGYSNWKRGRIDLPLDYLVHVVPVGEVIVEPNADFDGRDHA